MSRPPGRNALGLGPADVVQPMELQASDRRAVAQAVTELVECGSVQSQTEALDQLMQFQGPLAQQMLQLPVASGKKVLHYLREFCASSRADEACQQLARGILGADPASNQGIASSSGHRAAAQRADHRASQFQVDFREAMQAAKQASDMVEVGSTESEGAPEAGDSVSPEDPVSLEDDLLDIPIALAPPSRARAEPRAPQAQRAPPCWAVGQDCRGFIEPNRPAPVECGVLVANAMEVLSKAMAEDTRPGTPVEHLHDATAVQLLTALLQIVAPGNAFATYSLPVKVVSALVRLSPDYICKLSRQARASSQAPATTAKARKSRAKKQNESRTSRVSLRTMVRLALHNGAAGRPHGDFLHAMAQRQLEGAQVGSKYLNRHFPSTVEHIGAVAVSNLSAQFVNAPLPGLGIPSDFELFFDPGTIGKVFQAVRSTVMVTGVVISDPTSVDGSRAMLIGAPPASVNSKELEYESFKIFLESSPVQLDRRRLRSRMAVSTTDGAFVTGEDSHHAATHTLLQHMWDDLGLPARTAWDEFHRWNKVQGRAVKSVELAVDFFQLTRALENVLGFAQGRLIDKQVFS